MFDRVLKTPMSTLQQVRYNNFSYYAMLIVRAWESSVISCGIYLALESPNLLTP